MELVPFIAEHFSVLDEQQVFADLSPFMTIEYARILEGRHAYTVMDGSRVVACLGLIQRWPHYASGWARLSECGPRAFVWIHQRTRSFLDSVPYRRIETFVRCDFEKGHRWLRNLGFVQEAPRLRLFGPDLQDYAMYARIK